MMGMIFEDGATGAGIEIDLPASDPEWGDGSSFYDPAEGYGDVSYLLRDWRANMDARPGA